MNTGSMWPSLGVSASALLAERTRMGVIATNIAQAGNTRTPQGGPYVRKEVVFGSILDGAMQGGVRVEEVQDDGYTPHVELFRPGHQHAVDGMLKMPNVEISREMVDLMTASRAYEANVQASRQTVQMVERALELGR